MPDYKVDPKRLKLPETGIYIRATHEGKWGSHDLAHLDRASLIRWLERDPDLAERTVLALLRHTEEA